MLENDSDSVIINEKGDGEMPDKQYNGIILDAIANSLPESIEEIADGFGRRFETV